MILLDYNQTALAGIFMAIKNHTNTGMDASLIRHVILNSIRNINNKFRGEYGELIIACDDGDYWRKKKFPYYKAKRKAAQITDEFDWAAAYEALAIVKAELKEYFPYQILQQAHTEADDIIAVICQEYGTEFGGTPILIASRDKDYIQLHTYANVRQYDTIGKQWVLNNNPQMYLKEHIIRGDQGDGIPNILSQDAVFVTDGVRQKSLTQKKLDEFLSNGIPEEHLRNYNRNKSLIDFTEIPADIKEGILDIHKNYQVKDRSRLFNYFIKNRLKLLQDSISEF